MAKESEFLGKHKHSPSSTQDYLEFLEHMKAPKGKFKLIGIDPNETASFRSDISLGVFNTIEEAEAEAKKKVFDYEVDLFIYNDQGTMVKLLKTSSGRLREAL